MLVAKVYSQPLPIMMNGGKKYLYYEYIICYYSNILFSLNSVLGTSHSELQIERRVTELGLFMTLDEEDGDDMVATQQQGNDASVLASPAKKATLDLSIFDSGGSAGDIFEERNRVQERKLTEMYGIQMESEDDENVQSILAKRSSNQGGNGKLSLKKRKKLRTTAESSDDDDLLGEEGATATKSTVTTSLASTLRNMLDSDDEA